MRRRNPIRRNRTQFDSQSQAGRTPAIQFRRQDPHPDGRRPRRGRGGRAVPPRGIHPTVCYKWLKDFLEAGKARMRGDALREANSGEVQELQQENAYL